MKKSLTAALAALTFGGALAATAAPAQARDHGYYRGGYGYGYDRHRGNGASTALVAGVAGLAIGAAIAGSNHNNGGGYYNRSYAYNDGYYRDGYYGDRYYERPRYVARTCESSRWVWDPYIRERVLVRSRYAC